MKDPTTAALQFNTSFIDGLPNMRSFLAALLL